MNNLFINLVLPSFEYFQMIDEVNTAPDVISHQRRITDGDGGILTGVQHTPTPVKRR